MEIRRKKDSLFLGIAALLIAVALAVVWVADVFAAPPAQDAPPIDSIQNFLRWLALAGPAVAGALVSLLARKWAWFQGLSSGWKWTINFCLTVLLSGGAGLLLLYVPDTAWQVINPIFAIVAGAILAALGYVANQVTYLTVVKPSEVAATPNEK